MTYLELVNNILRRLRERTVSTVDETSYSTLVGVLINDAKEEVENAWNWSALRNTLTVTTVADTFNYELNGTQNRFKILDVVNDTSNFFMQYRSASDFNNWFLNQTPATGDPRYYSFNGISSDGDTQVDIYPIPASVYSLRFNVIQPQADLSADADVLSVPAKPVQLLAYAKAVEERGEDGGASASSAYATAARALNDAISFDSAKHPEEIIWES
jgi:hypothetical protein